MRVIAVLGVIACAGCQYSHGVPIDASPGDGRRDGPPDVKPPDDIMGDMTTATCPTSYTLHTSAQPNSFYRSVTASSGWLVAEQTCENDKIGKPTHLIVLDDDAERVWAFAQNNSDQWVGTSDNVSEGDWVAITDQPTVYVGSASGNLPNKDCLILNMADTFAEGCNNGHPYLCECDAYVVDATHF